MSILTTKSSCKTW